MPISYYPPLKSVKFLVPADHGEDLITPKDYLAMSVRGWTLPNDVISVACGHFICPLNFHSDLSVKALAVPFATGDYRGWLAARYGEIGEDFDNTIETEGINITIPVTIDKVSVLYTLPLRYVEVNDVITLCVSREGNDINDTINASVGFIGFLVEYIAKQ